MINGHMEITPVEPGSSQWRRTIEYAKNCSWKAGPFLAKLMEKNAFTRWEKVFTARDNDTLAGFCALVEKDCIPDAEYTPYISWIFVGEPYRGSRLSEKMIQTLMAYAKELGFAKIFLVSDHINLYEKYGFVKIDEMKDYWNNPEKIYMRPL